MRKKESAKKKKKNDKSLPPSGKVRTSPRKKNKLPAAKLPPPEQVNARYREDIVRTRRSPRHTLPAAELPPAQQGNAKSLFGDSDNESLRTEQLSTLEKDVLHNPKLKPLLTQKAKDVATILDFLKASIQVNGISDGHPFFSQLQNQQEEDRLLQDSFLQEDPDDEESQSSGTPLMSSLAREYVDEAKNGSNINKDFKIIVLDGCTQKKQVVLEQSDICVMYEGQEWLSTKLIDAYLSNLVIPDLHRHKHSRNCKCHYVDMSVMKQTLEDSKDSLGYTAKFEKLFNNKVENLTDYDAIFFGGTDDLMHFFLLALFPARDEFVIIDPFLFASTNNAVAKFLFIFLQHYDLVKQNKSTDDWKGDLPTYDFRKRLNEMKIKICKPDPGTKFVPVQLDTFNCGLHAILICEQLMRGNIPSYGSQHLSTIRKNGHLITSYATGVCMLGDRSVYSALHLSFNLRGHKMRRWQKEMFEKLPKQYCYNKEHENYEAFGQTNFIFQVLKPCSFETLIYHNDKIGMFNFPGRKLFTKEPNTSLLCCYGHFAKSLKPLRYGKCKTTDDLKTGLFVKLHCHVEQHGATYFDVTQNGIAKEFGDSDDKTNFFRNRLKKFKQFGFFGMQSVKPTDKKVTEEWVSNIVNNDKPIAFKDANHAIPMHFSFCEEFKTKLVVYTHARHDLKVTTSIYAPLVINTDYNAIEYHEDLKAQSFDEFPYQILAHQPWNEDAEEDAVWHFDVIASNQEIDAAMVNNNKANEGETMNDHESEEPAVKTRRVKKKRKLLNALTQELLKSYKQVRKLEAKYDLERKNQNTDTFFDLLDPLDKMRNEFQNEKRSLEKKLQAAGCANYELLKKRDIQEAKEKAFTPRTYHAASLSDPEKSMKMLQAEFGKTAPKLTNAEKKEMKSFIGRS